MLCAEPFAVTAKHAPEDTLVDLVMTKQGTVNHWYLVGGE
jgi:hypothetical protein